MVDQKNDRLPDAAPSDDALYGASRAFKQQVLAVLKQKEDASLPSLIASRHAADIADLICTLRPDERLQLLSALKFQVDPEVLVALDDAIRGDVLEIIGPQAIASAVSHLNTDDALDLIEDLNNVQQHAVLQAMPLSERTALETVLTYPPESAGRMMQREVICVPPFWTVGETLNFIRDIGKTATNYYDIYVVDPHHHPIGGIPLGHLLKHALDLNVAKIMTSDVHLVPVQTDQEEVAHIFQHYALVSAPVVDPSGRMVGMITVDDVVHVIHEEAEEDILHLANVGESDFYAPIITTAYWRMRWLIVTLLTSLLASIVIAQFQDAIQRMTALAFLMPISAAMGGSAGMQVVTIMVRALATRTLRQGNTWRTVGKEVCVSLLVGGFFAITGAAAVQFWMHDMDLAIVLSLGIFLSMVWSAFAGTLVPVMLDYFDLDPAVSAGPILMTTTDVFGFAIFLGLATLFLL